MRRLIMKQYRFHCEKDHDLRNTLLRLALIFLILIGFIYAMHVLSRYTVSSGAENLEHVLEADISEFYARYGYYPESLAELQDSITIAYSEDDYIINYQVTGANVRPSVTVLIRQGGNS